MRHLQPKFSAVSQVALPAPSQPKKKAKRAAPLSLRLSDEERKTIVNAAGGASLNSYIKSKVFDGEIKPRRQRGKLLSKTTSPLRGRLVCSAI